MSRNVKQCPICHHELNMCQCNYGGSAHPDRGKRLLVAFQHLYLFDEDVISNIIKTQEKMQICYEDEELQAILEEYERFAGMRGEE